MMMSTRKSYPNATITARTEYYHIEKKTEPIFEQRTFKKKKVQRTHKLIPFLHSPSTGVEQRYLHKARNNAHVKKPWTMDVEKIKNPKISNTDKSYQPFLHSSFLCSLSTGGVLMKEIFPHFFLQFQMKDWRLLSRGRVGMKGWRFCWEWECENEKKCLRFEIYLGYFSLNYVDCREFDFQMNCT